MVVVVVVGRAGRSGGSGGGGESDGAGKEGRVQWSGSVVGSKVVCGRKLGSKVCGW